MSGIVLTEVADATIPTPASGKATVYMSTEEAGPAFKDSAGAVTPLQGATGGTGPTGPGYGGTSTTSLAIGTGSKVFTTQSGLAYVAGSRVRAASDADPDTDWMEGVVASYVTTTLTVTVDLIGGSGTHTDWNLTLAGEQGEQGEGVPPTVVAHGAMGATETFDYGDGPAHSAEADAACTWMLSGATAGEVIMTIYLDVDSGGPYAITLPAAVANKTEAEAFLAAVPASTSVIVPFVTIDSGTTWTAMLDVGGDLDSVIAASSGQDIADALAGASGPDSSNVFATMADVGGGSAPYQALIQGVFPITTTGFSFSPTTDAMRLFSSGAQNDECVFRIQMAAGTWRLDLGHFVRTARGIYTIAISDDASSWTDLGTIDGYAGSPSTGNGTLTASAITGFTVATAGDKYIRVKMATKNASSGAYTGGFMSIGFTRTGA